MRHPRKKNVTSLPTVHRIGFALGTPVVVVGIGGEQRIQKELILEQAIAGRNLPRSSPAHIEDMPPAQTSVAVAVRKTTECCKIV